MVGRCCPHNAYALLHFRRALITGGWFAQRFALWTCLFGWSADTCQPANRRASCLEPQVLANLSERSVHAWHTPVSLCRCHDLCDRSGSFFPTSGLSRPGATLGRVLVGCRTRVGLEIRPRSVPLAGQHCWTLATVLARPTRYLSVTV